QLQSELGSLLPGPQLLGTSRVAVVLPAAAPGPGSRSAAKPAVATGASAQQPAVKEVRETLLVGEGTVSLLQKNGQLDMIFDPLTEVPTLSRNDPDKEINDRSEPGESLNDRLRQPRTELVEVLKETPVRDLRKAIGVNDRFLFIQELFRGDESMFDRSIKTINSFNIHAEAEYWITRELTVKLGWDTDAPAVQQFYQLVKRRFS
ncbi:MAG: hypothetical protein RJA57_915, partial [Bacteroidota bacterium]